MFSKLYFCYEKGDLRQFLKFCQEEKARIPVKG